MSSWHAEADRLRAEGLSIREIARRVGMGHSIVGEYFKGHYCDCGNRRMRRSMRCGVCHEDEQHGRTLAQARRLGALWAAGKETREIAQELGLTPGSCQVLIHKTRRRGIVDLPFRRRDLVGNAGRPGSRG